MNLSAPFIYRPVMTTMAMIALLFTGLLSYYYLPISNLPDINYPTINVRAIFPGALPETMANAVALPLEKQLMAIPGLRLVSSNNTLGYTSIVLQFEIDKDMTTAVQDVQAAITTAIPYLPPQMPYGPIYRKVNPAEQPVIYLGLTSKTLRRSELYTYANTLIGQRISMLEGVSQVNTFGSPLAIRIQVDPAQLVAKDVTLNEVSQIVQLENAYISTGQLDGVKEAPIIYVDGQLDKAEEYDELIVAYRDGTPVRIRDIGKAVENFQNNKINPQFVDHNSVQDTVVIAVQKEPNANTVAIADAIYDLLESLHQELPAAIDLHIVYDRSLAIRSAIEDANKTLLLALVLVILVMFLFLGKIADTIIPGVVLPMSIIGTFSVMYLMNFTLDNLSVLALTLSIGFIIDDAVVVLENIVRRVELGEPPLQASLEGSRQICFTIISMTMSLVAVFIPMLFMGGLVGKILSEFAITLTAVTIISGILSLTLTPMLSSRFIPPRNSTRGTTVFSRWSDRTNNWLRMKYRTILIAVLDHRWTAMIIGVLCTVATVFLLSYLPTDFAPDDDVGFFIIYTEGKEGGSSKYTLGNENKLIDIVRQNPAVENFVAISSYAEFRKGLNLVHLKKFNQRPPVQKVIQEIYADLSKIAGFQISIKNIPLIDLAVGQENRGAYQIAIQGVDSEKMYASARRMFDKMMKDPMFQGVNTNMSIDTPQIDINILRDQGSRLGINATDIENAFASSYSGNYISRIQTPIDQYQVILELLPEYQQQVNTLDNIWLRSVTSSELVPLSAVVKWDEKLGAASINHINQFQAVIISFNLAEGVPLENGLDRINEFAKEIVDPGITAQPIGAALTFNESIRNAGFLLLLTIFSIYIILGILYESFIHPITILSTLPPATLGGLLVLLILGLPLSLYSFLGIILLIGVVKKNGIMMVDFALENVRKGKDARESILEACMVRFRPIMMTTFAAICSVIPIALGIGTNGPARRPLGLVIIGGLLLSQLITLFITPIFYLLLERLNEKVTLK